MISHSLAYTPGEPAGIGIDILLKYVAQYRADDLVIICDRHLLEQRVLQLDLKISSEKINRLNILHVPLLSPVIPGQLNSANANYVLETLRLAAQGCMNKTFAGIVTGPVNKAIINQAGIEFSGHTEFFARYADVEQVVMMLANSKLRVALVTTHLPLKDVPNAITTSRLKKVCRILHNGLVQQYGIAHPTIMIAGLNPHAGENGYLGREELDVIIPALDELRLEGLNLIGPLPADTLFVPNNLAKADAFVAMYHDQGLAVLKALGFHESINITLGLPFIRTSVDHGTALDRAGTGDCSIQSLVFAIEQARLQIGTL